MNLHKLAQTLDLNFFTQNVSLDKEITHAYTGDLPSDVLGYSQKGDLLITIQSNRNMIAVAFIKNLSALILVNGITPAQEVIQKAEEKNIAIFGTRKKSFEISGEIFKLLNEHR